MSDYVETEGGLSVPKNAIQNSPSRQQMRADARSLDKQRRQYAGLVASGAPVARQGVMHIAPCTDPAHPFHVYSFCENHVRWEPMDDGHPLARVMIDAMIKASDEEAILLPSEHQDEEE